MSSRLLAVLIIFPVWLTLVLIFRKHRQWLFYYLIAAFGLTLQLVLLVEYLGWDQILVNVASFHVSIIGKYLFHIPLELLTQGRFQITLSDGSSSILKLGIECSAILESSIVVSLILFYPLFNFSQKILRALFALVITYVINILRLMIIVLMAYKFGPDYIFLAHAGVARLFFFACELLLYWYLMTKPSVKSVGVSIKNEIPLAVASHVGHALQLRNAIMQIAVILIIVGLGFGSFKMNNDWQKTLGPVAKENRPIIYKDETSLEKPAADSGQILGAQDSRFNPQDEQILGDFVFESILSQEEKSYQYEVLEAGQYNIRLVQGTQPVGIKIYKNDELMNLTDLDLPEEGPILDQNVFYQLVSAEPGDTLEVKFVNTGTETASYVAEIVMEVAGE